MESFSFFRSRFFSLFKSFSKLFPPRIFPSLSFSLLEFYRIFFKSFSKFFPSRIFPSLSFSLLEFYGIFFTSRFFPLFKHFLQTFPSSSFIKFFSFSFLEPIVIIFFRLAIDMNVSRVAFEWKAWHLPFSFPRFGFPDRRRNTSQVCCAESKWKVERADKVIARRSSVPNVALFTSINRRIFDGYFRRKEIDKSRT